MKWLSLSLCVALLGCAGDPRSPVDGAAGDAAASDGSASDGASDAGPIEIGDPLSWALDEPGPFRVGYRSFEHTYRPAGQAADRTIAVHLWYPTLDGAGAAPTYAGLVRDRESFTGAAAAEPAHASGRFPVHAYSHGHRGFAGGAAFLHRRLATHGWITVAPDHTGNTIRDNVEPRPVALWYLRSLDVRAAVDALAGGGEGVPELGPADTDRLLLTGHSFGTHTVWASAGATFDVARIESERCTAETPCTEAELGVFRAGVLEPRVVAVVPMAGLLSSDWFGDTGHASVELPVLAMTGSADANTMAGATAQFDRMADLEDFGWVDVSGACHEFFGLGCGDPVGEQERIAGTYVLALGRRHVLGDESAATIGVLDGTRPVSARATLRRH